MNAPQHPIERQVVLVGAGNAHLVFVRMSAMKPAPGVAVTLVSESPVVPYSAMTPGQIAGEYTPEETAIDLVRLCRKSGVRLVTGRAVRIDRMRKEVHVADRPPLAYDVLALGLGSRVTVPEGVPDPLMLRPLSRLVARLDELEAQLSLGQPLHLAIVGGGASGCELAAAIQRRLGRHHGFRLTLWHGGPALIPYFADTLARAGVEVRLNTRVRERPDADEVIWATDAAPPPLLEGSGLSLDPHGFLAVRPTLQAENDDSIFGTGDCVSIAAYPGLERNGVHAVRMGRVLHHNVLAQLRGQGLRRFRPQWVVLNLLNTADGSAVLRYGPLALKGRWARWMKDRIDREWVRKFTVFPPMKEEPGRRMRCGGCAAKVPGDVLHAALRRVDLADGEGVLLGTRQAEDAAVFTHGKDGKVEVQTIDYFKAFTDDPYLFGRVAALNAVSDLYAMNARPYAALAAATLPEARGAIQEALLREMLEGVSRSLRELGVVLAGGHTSEGADLALGLSVTGFADPARLFRKSGLRVGDLLLLTKPLGSGALLAAWMRGECRAEWLTALEPALLTSNREASLAFDLLGVAGCTDVTGFGLAGHLLEMLDASGASARLHPDAVPVHPGFAEVVAAGVTSTLHEGNARYGARVVGDAPAWMFDPQTSGGLLAGLRPESVPEALRLLREAGLDRAAVIGEVVARGDAPKIWLR
jgi:selenide,water dikinase